MDYHKIAIAFHLLGFALGLGGATISDIMFFKSLRNKKISSESFVVLKTLSTVIWIGLIVLIISGISIFGLIYAEQGSLPLLASPRWQMKLALVALVALNGLFFKLWIFPFLKNLVNQKLTVSNVLPFKIQIIISGTTSIATWYSIFAISMLPRSFKPSLMYFVSSFAAIVILGILISNKILNYLLKDDDSNALRIQ